MHRTYSVVVTSQALELHLLHTQCRHAALCWDEKCIICHMPLYSVLGLLKEEPSGAPIIRNKSERCMTADIVTRLPHSIYSMDAAILDHA